MTNLFAGMGSHQSARSQTTTWLTPPEIISELGPFDLDPCAAPGWQTASKHYYVEDDGLRQPWGGRVWLNPPYTAEQIREWMVRLADHDAGTALIFARTETRWFHESVWGRARAVLFLEGRLNFYTAAGRRSKRNAGAPSVLIAYGDEDTGKLADSDLRGAFVMLQNRHWAIVAVPRTWEAVVLDAYGTDRELSLGELYGRLEGHPKTENNRHWQAKVRQVVQMSGHFNRCRAGVWEARP